ncbi:hypothetical protein [Paenibacillus sp. TSA_86.1]|uniref:hypothetical protein n=1 Tax=Paenibacillus sp. TSA_86.1 TaxID=3415649 RepID=UPI00404572E5
MKESQRIKWEKQLKQGKRYHILVRGVLGWGLPLAFLYTLVMTSWNGQRLTLDGEFYVNLLTALVLFPAAGIWYGAWTWKILKMKLEQGRR